MDGWVIEKNGFDLKDAAADGTRAFHCTVPPQPSRPAYKLYMAEVIGEQVSAAVGSY